MAGEYTDLFDNGMCNRKDESLYPAYGGANFR